MKVSFENVLLSEVWDLNIKNRKVKLRRICVPLGARTFRPIHVTEKQLVHLNRIPVGQEVFLSNRYCQIGGRLLGYPNERRLAVHAEFLPRLQGRHRDSGSDAR